MPNRCSWVNLNDPLYVRYHDEEWGVPIRTGESRFFERLTLEGAQAGLSWITVLRKRDRYREVFDNFDAATVATYDDDKIASLLADPGIIRNRAKILATINNARCIGRLHEDGHPLADFLWGFVGGVTRPNTWESLSALPAATDESRAMSKALKKRGFAFVGPTTCYALMQATGMVNDHTVDCFRHGELI